MARAATACSAAILLLLAGAVVAPCGATELLTGVQATDPAGVEETSNLLPVHHDGGDEEDIMAGGPQSEEATLISAEDDDKKVAGSDWAKTKVDDEDDSSDSGSDSDSDSDSGSDSDSVSDSGSDSDVDSDSGSDSDSDSDDDDHNSKSHGSKKNHPAPVIKGAPGDHGKKQRDDQVPKLVIKV